MKQSRRWGFIALVSLYMLATPTTMYSEIDADPLIGTWLCTPKLYMLYRFPLPVEAFEPYPIIRNLITEMQFIDKNLARISYSTGNSTLGFYELSVYELREKDVLPIRPYEWWHVSYKLKITEKGGNVLELNIKQTTKDRTIWLEQKDAIYVNERVPFNAKDAYADFQEQELEATVISTLEREDKTPILLAELFKDDPHYSYIYDAIRGLAD